MIATDDISLEATLAGLMQRFLASSIIFDFAKKDVRKNFTLGISITGFNASDPLTDTATLHNNRWEGWNYTPFSSSLSRLSVLGVMRTCEHHTVFHR